MKRYCSLLIGFSLSCLDSSEAQTTLPDTVAFSRFYQFLPTVFHRNLYEYTEDSIPHKFIFATDSASLERNFDVAGRMTYEYLTLNDRERLIRYFDKKGRCFKYRDASESECIYVHTDSEPYQPLFDSSIAVSEKMLIQKFGKDFYTQHLRLSDPQWNTSGPYGYGSDMMQPFVKPSKFTSSVYLLLPDSIETYLGAIELDSLMRPVNTDYSVLHEILVSPKSDCIATTDFNSLFKIFKKEGLYFGSIEWDSEKKSFLATYRSEPYPKMIGKDTLWEIKKRTYDLHTKKYRTETYPNEPAQWIACGYHSPFKKEFKDTFQLEPGWRKIYLDEAIINIPGGWNLYTEKYSYQYKTTYITNGKDTLIYGVNNYETIRWESEHVSREDMVLLTLDKYFPDHLRLGRDIEYMLNYDENGCYTIHLTTYEHGVGLTYSTVANQFTFEKLCPGSIGLGLKILNSIRFHRY